MFVNAPTTQEKILVWGNVFKKEKTKERRCAMLSCCGCIWFPPIIFIDTHNLALVETDLASYVYMKRYVLWMASLLSIHRILELRILLAQLRSLISRIHHIHSTVVVVAGQPAAMQSVTDSIPSWRNSLCDPQILVSYLGVLCVCELV
ncbi:hypothetical protein SFRURICE_012611 [Spodoptera frugiperda]|nr:hypothetical protein SFRURICE_012611 [Spodoptera frugiperda]